MNDKSPEKTGKKEAYSFNVGTILTGSLVGFLGAAVLYRKNFPKWVPLIFSDNPVLFFTVFILICGFMGYVYSLPDE